MTTNDKKIDTKLIKDDVYNLINDTNSYKQKHPHSQYRDMTQEQYTQQMQNKYPYLYSNSATLFDRCIQGDLNISQFEYMLNMLDKVNNGADYKQTSIAVGQKLVDVYVKPMLDKNNDKDK